MSKLFASENNAMKIFQVMKFLGRIFPVAKKFTRKEQEELLRIMRGQDVLRQFISCLKNFDPDNEQCVWEYNTLKADLLDRLTY